MQRRVICFSKKEGNLWHKFVFAIPVANEHINDKRVQFISSKTLYRPTHAAENDVKWVFWRRNRDEIQIESEVPPLNSLNMSTAK